MRDLSYAVFCSDPCIKIIEREKNRRKNFNKGEKKGLIQRGENRERVILASLFTSLCVRSVPRILTQSSPQPAPVLV